MHKIFGDRANTPLGKELIAMLNESQAVAALDADDIAHDGMYARACEC